MSKNSKGQYNLAGKASNQVQSERPVRVISDNRKARFDYIVDDTIEAGLVLTGSEVKSLRAGSCQLKDSYVIVRNGELFLQNAHISPYRASSYLNHEPERLRKLLLKKVEIARIERAISERGATCVPLKIIFRGPWAKAVLGVVRGKQKGDKRDAIRDREDRRSIERAMSKKRAPY